jgi:hypothetical protein
MASRVLYQHAPKLDADVSAYLQSYVSDPSSAQTLAEDDGAELASFVRELLAYEELSRKELQDVETELRGLMGGFERHDSLKGRGAVRLDKVRVQSSLSRSTSPLPLA